MFKLPKFITSMLPATDDQNARVTADKDHTEEKAWWKSAIVYEIFPMSFNDSNGDGIGDLNGIRQKLDYLQDLGVTVIWLSPIYKSPLADIGYDVADYYNIDLRFGTLDDWEQLLKDVHKRGMKMMMDLVSNHSSDEHEWFVQSKASLTSPKRDWYIWRQPRTDNKTGLPNNWRSVYDGSVWQYDDATSEYYLHLFDKKQPDLNWENPEVRDTIWNIMKFWLDKGCDGFRMDVINVISKPPGLPDAKIIDPEETYQSTNLFANGPRVHEFLKEMHTKVLSKYDTITVGETAFTNDPEVLLPYASPESEELHMLFTFELQGIDAQAKSDLLHKSWKLDEFKKLVTKWQIAGIQQGFWSGVYIENHDRARTVSRFGNDSTDELQAHSAKLLALFQATQRGTLYIYQGQELGLKNFPRSWGIEDYQDVASHNWYQKVLNDRRKETGQENPTMDDIIDGLQRKARDHTRTPMQWDSSSNAGFSTGRPWMRVNDDYRTWNAAAQINNDKSVLAFWKKALTVRKQYDVLVYGDFTLLAPTHQQLFAYTRKLKNGTTALAIMNMSPKDLVISIPRDLSNECPEPVLQQCGLSLVLSNEATFNEGDILEDEIVLKPYDAKLYISSA